MKYKFITYVEYEIQRLDVIKTFKNNRDDNQSKTQCIFAIEER